MKRSPQIYLYSLSIFLFAFVFPLLQYQPVVIYSFLYIAASLLFILVCKIILKYDISPRHIFILVIAASILKLILIPIHPIGSDDYYRYLWDGKVIANGINPYRYAPSDPALAALHSKILPAHINFADMKTIYPPLAEILFYISYKIGGEGFIGLKFMLFVFDMGTILGIFLIVKTLGISYKSILMYALCPLPLFQFFVDGHMDGFGISLLVFGILFYLKERKFLSYLFIGLSICVKPLGLILIPLLFFSEKKWLDRFKVVLIPAAVCFILYLPFIFSGSPFQALITFTENWTFNGVVFDLLDLFFHDNQRTRAICGALLLIAYLPIVFNRKDLLTKIYYSIFLLFIFSPVVHPWYLSWLVFLIPVTQRWSGIVFVSLVSLTAFTVATYQLTGIWREYTAVVLLEYIPVLALFIYEMTRKPQIELR